MSSTKATVSRVSHASFGPQINPGGTSFRLWAPSVSHVQVVLQSGGQTSEHEMLQQGDGWFVADVNGAGAGDKYQFALNGIVVPDPASRYQPDDVHAASQLIDPLEYRWHDVDWNGRPWEETVIYELHVGTFSPAGTFDGVIEKLDYLSDLGITAVELMPLSDFPGRWNWGYDGVLPYAPDAAYGTPNDLKRLVDAAHSKGLQVFLDVVYNHFGPEGNYLHVYAKQFFNENHHTPWGAGLNFDALHHETVRKFFIENALYWLQEFNMDGLRFDAVHAIQDDSEITFLREMVASIRAQIPEGRHCHLVLENDDNSADLLVDGTVNGARRYDAQWNDDYHHCMHVLATAETAGYYSDYSASDSMATPQQHLLRVLTEGFAYQGEASPHREGALRGQKSGHLAPTAFVNFLQNHDQVGNRAFGERLGALAPGEAVTAMTAVLLLAPQVPLLFMGEEWNAGTPFYFFCNLGPDLAPLVAKGRREEFSHFEQFRDPAMREKIPDPTAESTYRESMLNWREAQDEKHARHLSLVRRLIELRQKHVVPLLKALRTMQKLGATANGTGGALRCLAKGQLLDEKVLNISWQFPNGAILTLLANLSNQETTVPQIRSDKLGTQLFSCGQLTAESEESASTADAQQIIGPWTVAWWVNDADKR